jgi:hypothetical protein
MSTVSWAAVATIHSISDLLKQAWGRRCGRQHSRVVGTSAGGIGDTIRVSLTPAPREIEEEVLVCQQILQSLGTRSFMPQVTACPGCGEPPALSSKKWPTDSELSAGTDASLEGELSGS